MGMIYNFGPIARTGAGGTHDTFNLASLPLHVTLDALMAATNRDEFVAWLWHDLFKPVFYWKKRSSNKLDWIHIPGRPPFITVESLFANRTAIPIGMVSTHHERRGRMFAFSEGAIIEDQFDQTGLGRSACFVQLSLAVEPAMTTAVVRAVIADSFIEAVVKDVAQSLHNVLASKSPSFSRIRFVFETRGGIPFSTPPTDAEIWQEVGQHFDVQPIDDELVIKHLTPVAIVGEFDTEVIVDLSGQPLTPEQAEANTLGLAELLTVYQDSRTVIMAVPQPEIYTPNMSRITSNVLQLARAKLKALDVLTVKDNVDLLKAAFETQVKIRKVPPGSKKRPIDLVIRWPTEQLRNAKSNGRKCWLCASFFQSNLPVVEMKRPDFTDVEYLGFADDLCPLCRIYWYNTHQYTQNEKAAGARGMRKALRGSFALVLPSSRFDVQDRDCRLVDNPPLDIGGRFDLAVRPLQRVTVTQQEFALFTQISRRIVAKLWRQIEPANHLPLPYLGGILLTHREANLVRKVLPALRDLFTSVTLRAYPFEARVMPNIELALEVVLTDKKHHHTKYTYLKSRPITLPVHPNSRLFVLADNAMQVEISRALFEACDRVAKWVDRMYSSQCKEWMQRVVNGTDPATAFYESTQTRLKQSDDVRAFNATASFWTAQFGNDPAQAWSDYERRVEELDDIFSRYPMLIEMFPALTERKEIEND